MINPKICPFCKEENKCGVENKTTSCWCKDTGVPPNLLDLIPTEYRLKACVCKNCIEAFKSSEEEFLEKHIKK